MKNVLVPAIVVLLVVAANPRAQNTPMPAPVPASEVKADFLRIIDRPRVAPDIQNHVTKPPYRNLITERFDFASERHGDGTSERVPVLLVRPEGVTGRLPVVLVLHGTSGKKEGMWNWLEQLAHRGFIAVAIDGRFHGERDGGHSDTTAYNEAIHLAFLTPAGARHQAHPWFFDNCWDVMRTIDTLVMRDDVDADRIGLTGTSKGGIESYLTAAVDDRIKVVVPAIAMQSFRWSLDHGRWQARANSIHQAHEMVANELKQPTINREVCRILWAKVVPGIVDEFDGPSMVRLLAGRPTLIMNGDGDANCPIEGAELAFAAARAAFHDVDADDRLKILVAKDTGHTVTHDQHQAALDWFVTWLKPVTPPSTARYLFRKAHPDAPRPEPKVADASFVGPRRPRPQHPRPSRRPFGQQGVTVVAPQPAIAPAPILAPAPAPQPVPAPATVTRPAGPTSLPIPALTGTGTDQ